MFETVNIELWVYFSESEWYAGEFLFTAYTVSVLMIRDCLLPSVWLYKRSSVCAFFFLFLLVGIFYSYELSAVIRGKNLEISS